MTNKQLAPKVRAWLKGTSVDPEDVRRSVGVLSGQVQQVRQRGRWWPLPSPRSKSHSSLASDSHSPTVIGRTHSMISPAKTIVAGALIFAVGGALFIAQPLEQLGGVPGAETEAVAPTWVTGHGRHVPDSCSQITSQSDRGAMRISVACTEEWITSDPRLNGDAAIGWIDDTYQTDDGAITVGMDSAHLQNEAGSWSCSASFLSQEATAPIGRTATCIGAGGYEGLSAVLVREPTEDHFAAPLVGLIFSGDIPPLPDPPAAE